MNVLRERRVVAITGLSRSTLWRLERRGDFPKRMKLSVASVGWPEREVLDWVQRRADARFEGNAAAASS